MLDSNSRYFFDTTTNFSDSDMELFLIHAKISQYIKYMQKTFFLE